VTIELLARAHGDCLVGAGTVLSAAEVDRVHGAGGRLVVAPNCDVDVIRRALELGMRVMPGIATATEAFSALRAGATELKLFPASTYGVAHLRALKSVLPKHAKIYPVGGVGSQDIAPWLESGADGFGFGGELFKPAYTLAELTKRAQDLMQALRVAIEKN
jgi:2-dehydro-3-deoxyphosphogalactonate aldolase